MARTPEHDPTFSERIPEGDDRLRQVCDLCGFIDYQNPRVIVGSVATSGDRILLCKRAIEPRVGYWTIPAGFLELNESLEEGAAREAQEEAGANLRIDGLLAVLSIPHIGQVQIVFHSHLENDDVAAGPESQEVGLFTWDEIPWDDMAFPSVEVALRHHREFAAGRAGLLLHTVKAPDGETFGL